MVVASLAGAAPAAAQETYTPSQAFASPSVTVGGKTARALCSLGAQDTMALPPGAIVALPPAPAPCSAQGIAPLRLRSARSASITLEAPADRLLAGWYRNGAATPLQPVRTGPRRWGVRLPSTSGRLLVFVIFEINVTATPYELRTDWKLSIRRPARAARPPGPPRPSPVGSYDDSG